MKQGVLSWIIISFFIGCFFITTQDLPSFFAEPIIKLSAEPQKISFHTPAFTNGTSLPIHITSNLTVGPKQGTILIHAVTTIEKGASLTILPGTTLAVSEFGGLSVFGTLNAIGTKTEPITFITNELNETNKHWVGILLQNSSNALLNNVSIHHASPAISCAPQAHTSIHNITFLLDAIGFARNTAYCTIN